MQRLVLVLPFLAACGVDGPADPSGGDDGPPVATSDVIGQVSAPGRLAIVGDRVVVAGFGGVEAVPLAGGDAATLAPASTDRYFVEPVAAADGIVIATLATSFGPDGDRAMHIDRVGLDGSYATLGSAYVGYGAGEGIVIVGDKIVYSTGGNAALYAMPLAGGQNTLLASDSGNFGDVVAIGNTAYYVNGWTVYSHELGTSSDHGTQFSAVGLVDEATLATDGTSIVAIGASLEDPNQTMISIVSSTGLTSAPPTVTLAGQAGDIAVAGNDIFAIAGGDIYRIDLATSTTSVWENGPADGDTVIDLAIAGDRLVWITLDGTLHARTR